MTCHWHILYQRTLNGYNLKCWRSTPCKRITTVRTDQGRTSLTKHYSIELTGRGLESGESPPVVQSTQNGQQLVWFGQHRTSIWPHHLLSECGKSCCIGHVHSDVNLSMVKWKARFVSGRRHYCISGSSSYTVFRPYPRWASVRNDVWRRSWGGDIRR